MDGFTWFYHIFNLFPFVLYITTRWKYEEYFKYISISFLDFLVVFSSFARFSMLFYNHCCLPERLPLLGQEGAPEAKVEAYQDRQLERISLNQ